MGAVQADISISLDGFVTRPNTDQHPGLGEGGRPLHVWVNDETGHKLLDDTFAAAGAVITSRTVFDVTGGWGDDGFYKMPVFVLTHRPHDEIVRGPTTFTFVTDGIESAVAQAKAAAGDRNVHIMGGASVIQQELNAGLVDELHLPFAPLLLGDGTPLFAALSRIALEPLGVIESTPAIHLCYRALRGEAAPARGSTTLGHLRSATRGHGREPRDRDVSAADAQSAARLRELAELLQQAAAAPA